MPDLSAHSAFTRGDVSSQPSISWDVIQGYNAIRASENHACFCYAPFTNMFFAHDGDVHVCCHNFGYSLGKYPEQSLREIWDGAKARELREHMQKYDLSHGCTVCEMDLKSGNYQEVKARHFDSIPRHPAYPSMMEFLISNQCNLECVMCSGEFSSLIRKNREKLPPLVTPYDKEFLRQLEEFIPYLHETRFSGSGEAFSIDMNYEIWEMILQINPRCTIMVQTNGTILTDRVKSMLARGNFQIGVSLDSLNKEVYESIRVNANFEKVMENVRYFSNYSREKGTDFRLAMCVMRQNWREMPEFIRFSNSLGAITTFHKVWYPLHYALHNLSGSTLAEIEQYLRSFNFPAETPLERMNTQHYQYFVSIVTGWASAQRRNATEEQVPAYLSTEELLLKLKNKLLKGIESGEGTPAEKELLQSSTMTKLASMLALFEGESEEKKITLTKMNGFPADFLLTLLKDNSAEFLHQQAKKYFPKATG